MKTKMTMESEEANKERMGNCVENFLAKIDVAGEVDADLNRASKPAIEKLKMLPELLSVMEKRPLQQEFLDRGVLSSFKNWLEPLPDGSLPNATIRSAVLKILNYLPIDAEVSERREQLKRSGLWTVVLFLSRVPEETQANKKLAQELLGKWNRGLFQKSTSYADQHDDEEPPRAACQTPVIKEKALKRRLEDSACGEELDFEHGRTVLQPGDLGYRCSNASAGPCAKREFVFRPQAVPLVFRIRPPSKVGIEYILAREREVGKRSSLNERLRHLRKSKRKNLHAMRLSVHGR